MLKALLFFVNFFKVRRFQSHWFSNKQPFCTHTYEEDAEEFDEGEEAEYVEGGEFVDDGGDEEGGEYDDDEAADDDFDGGGDDEGEDE